MVPDGDKKTAARQAAAKYSTNPIGAVFEYIKLSEQSERAISAESINHLSSEMLSLLEPYRHPVADKIFEHMIFIDPEDPELEATMYQEPEFFEETEGKIDKKTLSNIKKYIQESERTKIESAQFRNELNNLKTKLDRAGKIYLENKELRSDTKNKMLAQELGYSKGSGRPSIDKKKVFASYVNLVRKKGLSRFDSVAKIVDQFGIEGEDAAIKLLFGYRKTIIKKWNTLYPSDLPVIKKYLKGIVPKRLR